MPEVLKVDVAQKNNTINVYPWPITKDGVIDDNDPRNKFFANNLFFFKIPDRTVVKLKYSDFHFGALSLPIKVFLSSQADSLKNNTVFDANLNLMVGKKWGKEKFYHLPNAESGEKYFLGYSANVILGISKIELSDENTTPKITQKYTLPALSYGFAFGVHYKTIGIYMALGIDTPLSKYAKEWNFRNRPWLGFGLGLGL